MKKLITIIAAVICAASISMLSAAEAQSDTQFVKMYQHNYATNTTELVTLEIPINASGEPFDVGEVAPIPYMIIDPDSRDKINTVTSSPYNKILCLEILCDTNEDGIADGTYLGTGFMVASDVMLTAAHCFDNKVNGVRITAVEMRVHWHQNGTAFNSNYCTPYAHWIPEDYSVTSHINTDWAVVKLNKPSGSSSNLGSMVGYFGYESPADERLSDMQITVTGYPSDHEYYMYSGAGRVLNMETNDNNITEYCFRHNADMVAGQSGSPVYNSTNNIVVGINVREYPSQNCNEAMRLTDTIAGAISYAHRYTA